MKPEAIKIVQFFVEPYTFYTSNGTTYKNKTESHRILGLGDDMKIYQFKEHYIGEKAPWSKQIGWREYVPD